MKIVKNSIKSILRHPIRKMTTDRNSGDFSVPAENKYLWIEELNINRVFDIGANEGQFAQMMRKILPGAKIFSYEPLKKSFAELSVLSKGDNLWDSFNYGFGKEDSEMEINLNEYSPSSSFLALHDNHKKNFQFASNTTKEKVALKILDNEQRHIKKNDRALLKIDVQGFEKEVILGGMSFIPRVKLIIIELSFQELYQDQPLFDDIYSMLKGLGFSYAGSFDQLVSPINGQVLQQDGIFIRD